MPNTHKVNEQQLALMHNRGYVSPDEIMKAFGWSRDMTYKLIRDKRKFVESVWNAGRVYVSMKSVVLHASRGYAGRMSGAARAEDASVSDVIVSMLEDALGGDRHLVRQFVSPTS